MTASKNKKYDLDLDYFIIEALAKETIGYSELCRIVNEKYRHISDETFNDHIKHLRKSDWIKKDTTHAPFYLTEKCK